MNADDFDELAGRIEGMARALMGLAVECERAGLIDGPLYCARLRSEADGLAFPSPHLEPARRTLREIAQTLDEARARRSR